MGDENDKNKDKSRGEGNAPPAGIRQRGESFGGSSAETLEIDVDEVSLSKLRAAKGAAAKSKDAASPALKAPPQAPADNNKKKPPLSPPRPILAGGGGVTTANAPPVPPPAPTTDPLLSGAVPPSSAAKGPLELDHVLMPVLNEPAAGDGGTMGGAPLNETSKTPKATNHHRRIASNGTDTVSLLSQASNPRPRKLSMRDVMRHSPMETEADAYLQKAVEEYEENHKDATVDRARQSIFSQVPQNVSARTFRGEHTPPNSPGSRPTLAGAASGAASTSTLLPLHRRGPSSTTPSRHPTSKHRKVNSTADTLFQLSKDLDEINAAAAADGSAVEETLDGLRLVDSDADDDGERRSLLRNADVLLRDDLNEFRSSRRRPSALVARRATLRTKMSQPDRIVEENEESTGRQDDNDEDEGEAGDAGRPSGRSDSLPIGKRKAVGKAKEEFKDFEDWLKYKRLNIWNQAKVILFFIMLPCTGIAAILFYLAGNPPCGYKTCTTEQQGTIRLFVNASYQASASWWLLFLGCRQVITLSMARVVDAFVIDYLALQTKYMTTILGPYITLFIVQAKGWPFILFFWCIFDFVMLFGSNHFANHWLFYQDAIRMFSILNPSGDVPDSPWYRTLLIVCAVAPVIVAMKRYYLGIVQGRRLYNRYGEELSRVMERTLLINKVGKLAREIETMELRFENFDFKAATYQRTDTTEPDKEEDDDEEGDGRSLLQQGFYNISTRAKLNELLGDWEEPESIREKEDQPNIGDIIQFRHSLQYLSSPVPFGLCFGPSSTRQECVESSEIVYNRLLQSMPAQDVLTFDVIAMLAMRNKSGELDEELLSKLITLFRPDREGILTLLDFAKSIDTVYKELKMLRANVANASKLDRAFESIFNCIFYIILAMFFLGVLGFDPFALLAAVSALIVGFAFMINIACSSWVNGLLLILVRRPYDVGDRIHISNPQDDTDGMGSPGWFVKDIDLFTTTVVLGVTNEVATYANGSLANFRIINGTRSHKAILGFFMKFPLDVHYSKLRVFHDAIERFVRARPREWGALLAFRCTRVEADLGYVEYVVRAQHRESWHSVAPFASKADLTNFALELSKKMHIRYVSPPKPIDLTLKNGFPGLVSPPPDDLHGAGRRPDGGGGDARSLGEGSLDESELGHAAEDVAAMLFDIPLPPPRIEV